MPAPIGNKYYMNRKRHGRELKFSSPDMLLEKCYEYLQWCDENPWLKKEAIKSGDNAGKIIDIPIQRPPTIAGLCVYIGLSDESFRKYSKRKEFIDVATHVREIIEANQLEGAIVGAYNHNIIARKLGLADKSDITTDGKAIEFKGFNFLPYTPEADDE